MTTITLPRAAPTPELPPLPDERAAFEKAAHKQGCTDFTRVSEGYTNRRTLRCWRIWQARAALAQRSAEPHQGCACRWNGNEVVARCEVHEGWREVIGEWAERAKDAEKKQTALIDAARLGLEALDKCRDWPGAVDECVAATAALSAALANHPKEGGQQG